MSGDARDPSYDSNGIRVRENDRMPEGKAANCCRHIVTDAGEFLERNVVIGNLTAMILNQCPSHSLECRDAPGQSKRVEGLHNSFWWSIRQRSGIWIGSQEFLIDRDNLLGPGAS